MDMGSISALASSLKTASEIAKAMIDLRDATAFQTKAFELTREILAAQNCALAAQESQFALLEKIRNLEKELGDAKAWASEKEKYELKELERGVFAHVAKITTETTEPLHALCPACYENSKKSILQSNNAVAWTDHHFQCPSCKATFKTRQRDIKKMLDAMRAPT